MDIQPKKRIAEPQQDPVIDAVVKVKNFMTKNGAAVIICCTAALVIAGGGLIYGNMKASSTKKAQEIFGIGVMDYADEQFDKALASFSDVANNFRHTPLASMSAFMMGSIYLQQNNYDQAVTWFEAAVNGRGESGFVKAQAYEGLAAAYEEKGDAVNAVRYLEKVLKDRNAAHRHAAARFRLALLNKNNPVAASAFCKELIADSSAAAYHQKAENLLAAIGTAN
ncbi:MAG: tetratricopeptide repeat protein [Chitinispirillales bacterium]|nr:tetratricopeptide repeat protein [Chitinispirillales bacterium]